MTADLMKLDATAQATLIREAQVSPLDLVDTAIARIQRVDPVLNAVITPLFEQARRQAQSTRSTTTAPFHGVPLLLNDYLCQTTGDPYYAGMRYLRDLGWRSPRAHSLPKNSERLASTSWARPICQNWRAFGRAE